MNKLLGGFLGLALVLAAAFAGQACVTDADCDDHNACDGAEYCQGGVCFSRAPLVCDDGDPCTVDGCDSASGCTVAPSPGCMLGGMRMKLASRNTLHILIQSQGDTTIGGAFPVKGSNNDPVVRGASVRVFTTAGDVFDNTYGLPSSKWAYVGSGRSFGYFYKDLKGQFGPIRQVVAHAGKPTKIKGEDARLNFSLLTNPNPVNVQIRYGDGLTDCLRFGGMVKYTANVLYQALHAPAPTHCP